MNDWQPRMRTAVRHLAEQLAGIRVDAAGPGLVESIRVGVDGREVPLGRLAKVANRSGRFVVHPIDAAHVPAIVKALAAANLGAYALDPRTVAVTMPPISGDRRSEIARHVKALAEDARVAVRRARQDARKQFAAAGRGPERKVQEATDAAVAEIDALVARKLREVEINP